jgi:hypothetical protein
MYFADMWEDCSLPALLLLKQQFRFRFSLASGELRLDLEALKSLPAKRNFRYDLPIDREVRGSLAVETTDSHEAERGITAGWSEGTPQASVSVADTATVRKVRRTTESYARHQVTIAHKGSQDAPTWAFRSGAIDGTLTGGLTDWLATLDVVSVPCRLTARFTTSFDAIRVLEVDSPQYAGATPNKQAALRVLMRKHVRRRIDQWVSKCDVGCAP